MGTPGKYFFCFLKALTCCFFMIVRLSHLLLGNGFRVGALGCSFRNFGLEPCFLLAKVASLDSQTSKNPEILNMMGRLRILELPNF